MSDLVNVDTGQILASPNGQRELLATARRALVEACELPHFAMLAARAEVIRVAVRAAGLSTEAQNDWTRYKVDCERGGAERIALMRAAGELIGSEGGRPGKPGEAPPVSTLGVKPWQAKEWAKLSELTEEELSAEFERANKAGKAVAESALVKKGAAKQTKARRKASRDAKPLPDGAEMRYGDARKVLADVPDASVHLVLTDPPYGDEAEPLYEWLAEWSARVLVPGGSLICYTGQSRLDRDVAILSGHLRYWWTLAMLHHQSQRLPGKFVVAEWKPVLWYVKEHRRGRSLVTDVLRSPARDKSAHAWAQGEGGTPHLIEHLTDPGELIADPFAGSRRWADVVTGMGRRWIGADIEQGGDGAVVVA